MERVRAFACAVMILLLSGCATSRVGPGADAFQKAAQAAVVMAQADNPATLDGDSIERVVEDPRFESLDAPVRAALVAAAGRVAWREGSLPDAKRLHEQALAIDDSDPNHLFRLTRILAAQGSERDAAERLRQFAQRWPQYVDAFDERDFWTLVPQRLDPNLRAAVLQALFDAEWVDPSGMAVAPGPTSRGTSFRAGTCSRPVRRSPVSVIRPSWWAFGPTADSMASSPRRQVRRRSSASRRGASRN